MESTQESTREALANLTKIPFTKLTKGAWRTLNIVLTEKFEIEEASLLEPKAHTLAVIEHAKTGFFSKITIRSTPNKEYYYVIGEKAQKEHTWRNDYYIITTIGDAKDKPKAEELAAQAHEELVMTNKARLTRQIGIAKVDLNALESNASAFLMGIDVDGIRE